MTTWIELAQKELAPALTFGTAEASSRLEELAKAGRFLEAEKLMADELFRLVDERNLNTLEVWRNCRTRLVRIRLLRDAVVCLCDGPARSLVVAALEDFDAVGILIDFVEEHPEGIWEARQWIEHAREDLAAIS